MRATGATFVNSGGVLKGNGIIGDDVTLAPGSAYGQLTIKGDLILSADAVLAMELGQAGTPVSPSSAEKAPPAAN